MLDRRADFAAKLDRLAALGRDLCLDAVVLREPASLVWLLEARVHVPQTLDSACLDIVVDLSGKTPSATVVTNAIEAPRLRETELSDLPLDWRVVPWWESRDAALPTGSATGSDRPSGDTIDLTSSIAAIRRVLTARQQGLLTAVCADAAAAATVAATAISPATTEYGAVAVLASALLDRDLDPIVLMAAGDDRRRRHRHRHPLPTDAPIGRRAMLVCCARRDGLVSSVTRFVAFGELDATEARDIEQCWTSSARSWTRACREHDSVTPSPAVLRRTRTTASQPTNGTGTTRADSAASNPASSPHTTRPTRSRTRISPRLESERGRLEGRGHRRHRGRRSRRPGPRSAWPIVTWVAGPGPASWSADP